jgi:hypothetical protein
MALEVWPEQLNYLAQRGTFAHKPGDPNVRSDYDSGPSRVRQRFTSAPNIYQFQVLLNSLEKLALDGFLQNVIHAGADWFSMPVVVAGDYLTATVRILKDGVNWSDAGYDKWTLSLNIEIRDLPTLTAVEAYLVGTYGNPSVFDPIQIAINITYPHAVAGAISAKV